MTLNKASLPLSLSLSDHQPHQKRWHTILKKIQEKPQFKLGDFILIFNSTPILLGITLDEQLSLIHIYIQNVAKKASTSLRIIREVKGISKVSIRKLIHLYVSVVHPIMDYDSVIWQGSKQVSSLSTIQRKALSICLGLQSTAGSKP